MTTTAKISDKHPLTSNRSHHDAE